MRVVSVGIIRHCSRSLKRCKTEQRLFHAISLSPSQASTPPATWHFCSPFLAPLLRSPQLASTQLSPHLITIAFHHLSYIASADPSHYRINSSNGQKQLPGQSVPSPLRSSPLQFNSVQFRNAANHPITAQPGSKSSELKSAGHGPLPISNWPALQQEGATRGATQHFAG